MDDPKPARKKPSPAKPIAAVVLLILVGVGGFCAGISYQKSHGKTTGDTSMMGGQFSQGGPRGNFSRNGTFGSVTAISASSITVQDQQSGSSKTYKITSSTTISNNGSSATYSDIATGDTVMVTASDSTATTATHIIINPSMGGMNQQSLDSSDSGAASGVTTN